MSNFPSLAIALFELADNAFDEFDGYHGGTHLNIYIEIGKKKIIVENIGGKGMGVNEIEQWLEWGEQHKTAAIGEYGQGGKAAMGYIGNAWVIKSKRFDESLIWELAEDNWADTSTDVKEYQAYPKKSDPKKEGLGFCRIEISKLNRRRQDIPYIKSMFSNIYRRHLLEGKATIILNGELVQPIDLPLYDGFDITEIKSKTKSGWLVKGWIGRLKRDAIPRGGPKIRGGMRLLRQGRLITDGEYFGHPDYTYKASLGMLTGECELAKVPVLPNKTEFDTDSAEWEEAKSVMYDVLKPHVEDLLKQKDEDRVTYEEKKKIAEVRHIMIKALELLHNETGDILGDNTFGTSSGRQPSMSSQLSLDIEAEAEKIKKEGVKSTTRKKQQPRTPPPKDAIGRLRRLGKMPPWEGRVLSEDIRSDWEYKDSGRCLLINKKYCIYEERKGDDMYIAETAALELAKPQEGDKLNIDEYLSSVSEIMRAFCEVYDYD